MSKKRWDKPNEILWSTVLMVGLFFMSGGENLIVLLISLGMPIGLAAAIEKKFSFSNPQFWMYKAFRYGVIQGKRMEREKRKRQSVNA